MYNPAVFTIEHRVGRLGEIRIDRELRLGDMSIYRSRFAAVLQSVVGKVVWITDARTVEGVAPEVEVQGTELMRVATPRIERAAMVVGRRGTFGVQLLRASQATNSHIRRVFADPAPAIEWLDEVLSPGERARVRAFFAAAPPCRPPEPG